jgi:hypothetical protein
MKQTIYIEYELALNPIYNEWEYLNLPSRWIHNPISDIYKNNSAHVIESFCSVVCIIMGYFASFEI